jgi:hypothetical protein
MPHRPFVMINPDPAQPELFTFFQLVNIVPKTNPDLHFCNTYI